MQNFEPIIFNKAKADNLCTKSSSKSDPEPEDEEDARKGRLESRTKLPTNNIIMSDFLANLDHSCFL